MQLKADSRDLPGGCISLVNTLLKFEVYVLEQYKLYRVEVFKYTFANSLVIEIINCLIGGGFGKLLKISEDLQFSPALPQVILVLVMKCINVLIEEQGGRF